MSASFECDFKRGNFWVVGLKYSCEVKNNPQINTPESAVIEYMTGRHENGKTNNDVTFFRAGRKEIEHFPQGLEKFFPNLRGIVLGINKIKKISASDLKPFPKLTYLNMGENPIEVLEDGLFANNPDMETIVFWGDKITHIGSNAFDNLPKLTSLSLGENPCINLIAEQSAMEVKEVIEEAKLLCKNNDLDDNSKITQKDQKPEELTQADVIEKLDTLAEKLGALERYVEDSLRSFDGALKDLEQRLTEKIAVALARNVEIAYNKEKERRAQKDENNTENEETTLKAEEDEK